MLGALTGTLASMSLIIVIPLVVGIYMVVRDGVRASGRWWRNAGVAIANGASAIVPGAFDWLGLILISFVLPAVLCWAIGQLFRRMGWIREGDLKLN